MCDRRKQAWAALFIGNVLIHTVAIASPIYVPQFLPGSTGRNIRHLPCVSRRSGETGVCMFAFTCAKANGTHLGTCIDRFYFGSCCKIDDEPDIFPQDNSIDDGLPSPPRPFVTTDGPVESNDIPEYFARPKPTAAKNPSEAPLMTTPVISSTQNTQTSASTVRNTTKFVTRKPTSTIETTTQTTRLTTFQTVQSAPEGASSTEATLSRNTTGAVHKPSSVSTSTRKPTKPSISTSTVRPSIENTTRLTTSATVSKATTRKPVSATTVQKPTTTQISHKPISSTTRRPIQSTTTKGVLATTQKTIPSTRFPPRNTTSSKPLIQTTTTTSRKPVSSTKRPTTMTTTTTTATKRPVATTKKPSTLTKRPSISSKPLTSSSFGTTLPVTSKPHSTSGTFSNVAASSTSVTESILALTGIRPSTATTTATSASTSQRITTTTKSADQKLTSTRTTTPKTTSKTTTKAPTIKTTTIRATTVKTTTDSRTTTSKPSSSTTTRLKPAGTTTKIASTTTKIASTTTRTTRPEYTSSATTTITENTRPLSSTIGATIAATRPRPTTTKPTKPVTKVPSTTIASSIAEVITTTGVSSSTSAFTVKNETTTTRVPPTKGQDVNNTLEEIPLTTYSPGLVTWSSNSDDVSTKASETSTTSSMSTSSSISSSSASTVATTLEQTEADWSPITTPDGWIMIQSPTTEKLPQTQESTTEPVAEPTIQSLTSAKPVTESTTTIPDYVTKKPTMATLLSTIASVTIDTELPVPMETLNMSDYKQVCGRRLFPESRIVGGTRSSFGKWPWQISLRQWRTSTYLHKCGAALLNENWAITAAHCVESVPPSDLLLRIGEHDLANEDEPYGYQERRVQIVASHPQFDARTFEYDLALLRFYEPLLPFQPNVLPICLPDDDETYVGRTAYVTGWGRLYDEGPLPSVLQEVAVPVINNTVCESMYRNAGYIEHIPHIFICAGWRNGGFDSCEGDSGGPMVIQRARDKRWILAGIISWGIGCAAPNQPGVYTRISEFREWINQILQF